MKKTFVKDGKTFVCVATEENVKHLALSGWELQDKPVENPVETAIIEAPAPKRGRPFKGTY